MTLATEPHSIPRAWARRAGLAITAVPALVMLASAAMKLAAQPDLVSQVTGRFGWERGALPLLAGVEILCVALYLIPFTRLIGAILLTGYLGGAVATHMRVADSGFLLPLALGLVAWLGIYLRDQRLRDLLRFPAPSPRGSGR